MKLLIVAAGNFFSNYGGGQVYVKNLVDELIHQKEKTGIEVSLLSIHDSFSPQSEKKAYKDIPLYEIHPAGNIQTLIQTIQPDIVHAHGEKAKVSTACKELRIPCIITAHHGGICCPAGTLLNSKDEICRIQANPKSCLPCYLRNIRIGNVCYPFVKHIPLSFYLGLGKFLKHIPFIPFVSPIGEAAYSINEKFSSWSAIAKNATKIIAPSHAIKDSMVVNGCDESKIIVVPHGIPIPNHPQNLKVDDKIKFFYVGRICHVKGIHVMLKAFSSVKNNNIELHIIGGTGNKTELRYQKRLQKKYVYDNRITWHGKVDATEVGKLVASYHCLIHPAIYLEVFGLNIAEALAQHKYVIATRCGGAEMQIHNASEGTLVPPNSSVELSLAILKYIQHPIVPSIEIPTIEKHIQGLIDIYQTFCHNSQIL